MLALNSFWLVRNRHEYFGSCNYSYQLTCFNFSERLVADWQGEIDKMIKVKQT